MKKIILCADDYGQNQSISQAVITLLEKKRLSAVSCMTTAADWQVYAKWLAPFQSQADMGLHFNLTEGEPLSAALKRSHGFMPLMQLLFRAYWRLLNGAAIEAELNAQLDAFQQAMGRLPDFLDGHQHIHQLPVVRKAVFRVYEKRLRQKGSYLRCVYDPRVFLRIKSRTYVKSVMIQLLGAGAFKQEVLKQHIPHNASFSGVYQFSNAKEYARIFPRFLSESEDRGLIMCHPGLAGSVESDPIARARFYEFDYLESEQFLEDCRKAVVQISKA
jgi:predicted glycoside hydrolase/deacetylase ChbG (UPF0249 family)